MTNFLKKEVDGKLAVAVAAFFVAVCGIFLVCEDLAQNLSLHFPQIPLSQAPLSSEKVEDIKTFSSEQEFKDYLVEGALDSSYGFSLGAVRSVSDMSVPMLEQTGELRKGAGEAVIGRVSDTNVQVAGIDEPDIVKTDGKEIYFSQAKSYYGWGMREMIALPHPSVKGETKIIKAFPPSDLDIDSSIAQTGNLLLDGNNLIIFSGQDIYGYDVSDSKSPEKKWDIELEDNSHLVSARLYKNKIYLVTKDRINIYHPCPIRPLTVNGAELEIKCVDIYHPVSPVPIDVVFTATILNPKSGKVEKKISFVGSSGSSIVYMSENSIYATYSYYESMIKFFADFLKEEARDIFPSYVIAKLDKLEEYDISQQAKLIEFQIILEKYMASLDRDERLRIENEMENRMNDYYKKHKRELEKTGIIKIGLEGFKVKAAGKVPGRLLNQFALDEYKGNLRVAITIGDSWFMGRGESANDVYVLDKNLKIQGAVKDMGLTERIYSVRFIQDKGYVVTYRQIDPFYVLDLSDPKNPELKGELKIPGYSAYLHPLSKDKILGIGKEGSKIKISLFDVEFAEKPIERDKYLLNEYWSDILNTHHAFLLDKKHNIFFLPGSKGGYIFSYENDKLQLKKAISQISARRAIYINDYLYIIGENKITVLNEIDWEKVQELDL
ncbi:beta-propeller domain-containing protein [Candidatus Parcubacteria bacterium]|nr:beta-propeller domain-containing protein [Candidatus Parcubacteria bacterium]